MATNITLKEILENCGNDLKELDDVEIQKQKQALKSLKTICSYLKDKLETRTDYANIVAEKMQYLKNVINE